jgi:hypothetical protein
VARKTYRNRLLSSLLVGHWYLLTRVMNDRQCFGESLLDLRVALGKTTLTRFICSRDLPRDSTHVGRITLIIIIKSLIIKSHKQVRLNSLAPYS